VNSGRRRSEPPSPDPWVVAIAASAGGIKAIGAVLETLPHDLPAAVIVIQHRSPEFESVLESILMRRAHMPVVTATSGDRIMPGVVYVARPDLHLIVRSNRRFAYTNGTRIKFLLSSANPLLATAASAFAGRLIAVVLTGYGSDATDGVQSVKAHGGLVIVQDRATAEHWNMPEAALKSGAVDFVLPLDAIGPAIDAIVHGRSINGPVTVA
jgi:two-component system chemotaxis response regulator CheB